MSKILLYLLPLSILVGCSIVSLDEVSSNNNIEDEIEQPDTDDIDAGSNTVPSDSATFAVFLHGEESKTWTTEEFIIEGLGITQSLSCRLDDVITMNADGTVDYESGQWSCGGEEGDAIDRTGSFTFDLTRDDDPFIDFIDVTGFEADQFSGRVWTLEENVMVISGIYESSIFGTFTVTGRYVSN